VPELFFTSEVIAKSKNENRAFSHKNILSEKMISHLSWQATKGLFRDNLEKDLINFYSFATCSINLNEINDNGLYLINSALNQDFPIHPGEKIASSLSISFIGKNDNKIKDDQALEFKNFFENKNPFKVPKILPPFESIQTPKFFYSVDTFFIQINGSSIWKIDSNYPEEHTLGSGDIIFIPKKLVHSAEYLSPGSILSLSFAD
jgi:mannose-6-phosphate isomerase-like protein (cupin superfamily)